MQVVRDSIRVALSAFHCDEALHAFHDISGINGNFRNIACMELPAELFGKARFKVGDAIEFASTFLTHCRSYRVEWKGKFTLRGK